MAICKHCHDNVILIVNFAAVERKGNAKYLNKRPMRIISYYMSISKNRRDYQSMLYDMKHETST